MPQGIKFPVKQEPKRRLSSLGDSHLNPFDPGSMQRDEFARTIEALKQFGSQVGSNLSESFNPPEGVVTGMPPDAETGGLSILKLLRQAPEALKAFGLIGKPKVAGKAAERLGRLSGLTGSRTDELVEAYNKHIEGGNAELLTKEKRLSGDGLSLGAGLTSPARKIDLETFVNRQMGRFDAKTVDEDILIGWKGYFVDADGAIIDIGNTDHINFLKDTGLLFKHGGSFEATMKAEELIRIRTTPSGLNVQVTHRPSRKAMEDLEIIFDTAEATGQEISLDLARVGTPFDVFDWKSRRTGTNNIGQEVTAEQLLSELRRFKFNAPRK